MEADQLSTPQAWSNDVQTHGIRVAMIVTGFPHPGQPNNGSFNASAVKALRDFVKLSVIHLRAWRPGRRGLETSDYSGIPVVTVAVPQLPRCFNLNLTAYQYLGWRWVRPFLQSCDLLHSVEGSFAGVLASTWGRWLNVRHVTQLVGGETTSMFPQNHVTRRIAGWEKHLHGVACNSQALVSEFLEYYPSAHNVRSVYRGVDLNIYSPNGPVAGPLAGERPVRYLFLGGFPPCAHMLHGSNTKGGKTLLVAWQEAEAELYRLQATLLIAGPKSDTYSIRRWRAGLRYPGIVHLEGRIHPDIVPNYIRSSDVVLIPSMEEGLPNVAMEASACARAVFGSNVGGIPEIVLNKETGLILPAGEVVAWKNALVGYASRPAELKKNRRACQNTYGIVVRLQAVRGSNIRSLLLSPP